MNNPAVLKYYLMSFKFNKFIFFDIDLLILTKNKAFKLFFIILFNKYYSLYLTKLYFSFTVFWNKTDLFFVPLFNSYLITNIINIIQTYLINNIHNINNNSVISSQFFNKFSWYSPHIFIVSIQYRTNLFASLSDVRVGQIPIIVYCSFYYTVMIIDGTVFLFLFVVVLFN